MKRILLSHPFSLALFIGLVLFLSLHAAILVRAPVFWEDEGVCLSSAAYMTLANPSPIMRHMAADGTPLQLGNYPPLYFGAQRLLMEIAGVNLWASRMVNVVFASGALLLLALLAREVGLGRIGILFSVFWLMADDGFVRAMRNGRPDMMCFLFAIGAFYAYARYRNSDLTSGLQWGATAGILAILSLGSHHFGIIVVGALVCLALADVFQGRLHRRSLALIGAPIVVAGVFGVGYLLSLETVDSGGEWRATLVRAIGSGERGFRGAGGADGEYFQTFRAKAFAEIWLRYLGPLLSVERTIGFAVQLGAILSLPWLLKKQNWGLVLLLGFVVMAGAMLWVPSRCYYSVHLSLWFALACGGLLDRACQAFFDDRKTWGIVVIAVCLLALLNLGAYSTGGRIYLVASQWHLRDPEAFRRQCEEVIPDKSVVMSDVKFWYFVQGHAERWYELRGVIRALNRYGSFSPLDDIDFIVTDRWIGDLPAEMANDFVQIREIGAPPDMTFGSQAGYYARVYQRRSNGPAD